MAFEEILNMHLQVKYQKPERLTICPQCGYPLEDSDRGLHCLMCEWTPAIPPKFIPQIPDVPK